MDKIDDNGHLDLSDFDQLIVELASWLWQC